MLQWIFETIGGSAKWPAALAASLFLLVSNAARGELRFELLTPLSPLESALGGYWHLNISGVIEPNSARHLEKFLADNEVPASIVVHLDSSGGSVLAAQEIGRILRRNSFTVQVGRVTRKPPDGSGLSRLETHSGRCFSACTLAFLGGRFRYLDSDSAFGVHRFYFQNPTPQDIEISQVISAAIAAYLVEMGIDVEFMAESSRVPSDNIGVIPVDRLRALAVVNDGITEPKWETLGVEGALYTRAERDTIYGHQKLIVVCAPDRTLLYYGVFETMNRDEELMNMGSVFVEIDGEQAIDLSHRVKRQIVNGYMNAYAPISRGEAARILAAKSIGLIFQFSPEAPVFLGIGGMPLEGGRERVRSLVGLCLG